MGYINVEIPEELHRELRILRARSGEEMREIIKEALKEKIEREKGSKIEFNEENREQK